jgi:hypothetical protein
MEKLALAMLVPSVAITVCAPYWIDGTLNVMTTKPLASVSFCVISTPSMVTVTVLLGMKPLAPILMVPPTKSPSSWSMLRGSVADVVVGGGVVVLESVTVKVAVSEVVPAVTVIV